MADFEKEKASPPSTHEGGFSTEKNAAISTQGLQKDDIGHSFGVNEKALVRKLDYRLLPPLTLLYLLSFLDRSNGKCPHALNLSLEPASSSLTKLRSCQCASRRPDNRFAYEYADSPRAIWLDVGLTSGFSWKPVSYWAHPLLYRLRLIRSACYHKPLCVCR